MNRIFPNDSEDNPLNDDFSDEEWAELLNVRDPEQKLEIENIVANPHLDREFLDQMLSQAHGFEHFSYQDFQEVLRVYKSKGYEIIETTPGYCYIKPSITFADQKGPATIDQWYYLFLCLPEGEGTFLAFPGMLVKPKTDYRDTVRELRDTLGGLGFLRTKESGDEFRPKRYSIFFDIE